MRPQEPIFPNLLLTKILTPVALSRQVLRNRLVERFADDQLRPITMVVAPAGYGKTTLLCQSLDVLSRSGKQAAWVSLDEFDNEPARFWSYVSEGISRTSASIRKGLAGIRKQDVDPVECPFIANLINVISEEKISLCLILDDYHSINNKKIHEAVEFFLNHLPHNMNVVIASRTTPPFALARFRANKILRDIQADDLYFTFEETSLFLSQVMNLNFRPEEVTQLLNATWGWIAGLQLAAISLGDRRDVQDFVSKLNQSPRYAFLYLFDEVFNRQEESVKDFLLKTCILDKFNASICNAVTGGNQGKEIIEAIFRANLFISSLDEAGDWYRYHPLFSDTLKQELTRKEPDIVPELHRRASEWFEKNGLIEQAINHSLASGDVAHTEKLIQKDYLMVTNLLLWGDNVLLRKWLEKLQHQVIIDSPSLSMLLLWGCIYQSRFEEIHSMASIVQQKIQTEEGFLDCFPKETIEIEIIIVQACSFMLSGDYAQSMKLALRGMELVNKDAFYYRCYLSWCLGESHERMGNIEKSYQFYHDTYNLSELAGGTILSPFCIYEIGRLQTLQGKMHLARNTFEKGLMNFGDANILHPIPAGLLYIGLGRLFVEWNQLEHAEYCINKGVLWISNQSPIDWHLEAQTSLALLRQAQGKREEAFDILSRASIIAGSCLIPREIGTQISIELGKLCVEMGNLEQGRAIRDKLELKVKASDPYYAIGFELLKIRIWAAEKNFRWVEKSEEILSRALEWDFLPLGLEMILLRAIARQKMGQTALAIDEMTKGLVMAMPEGYLYSFKKEKDICELAGSVLKSLQLHHKRADQSAQLEAYVQRILVAFEKYTPGASRSLKPDMVDQAVGKLIEPLSVREAEIISLAASGLERKEICQRLAIAPSTLKSHFKHIYDKLDAHSLSEAIATAYEHQLF